MKEYFKKLLIDIPAIVVSVLIALGINEWNDTRQRNELKENILTAVRAEMRENRTRLQSAVAYHEPLAKDLVNGTHRMFSVPLRSGAAHSSAEVSRTISEFIAASGELPNTVVDLKPAPGGSYRFTLNGHVVTARVERDTAFLFGRSGIALHAAVLRTTAWKTAQAAQIAPYLDYRVIARLSEIDELQRQYARTVESIVNLLYSGNGDVTYAVMDLSYFEREMLHQYDELQSLIGNTP